MDIDALRNEAKPYLIVSHTSILIPFILGAALALLLYERQGQSKFLSLFLFLGISMSIKVFPVLARILREKGLTATPLDRIAIAIAAIGVITAWSLLAEVPAIFFAMLVMMALATTMMTGPRLFLCGLARDGGGSLAEEGTLRVPVEAHA